MRSEPASPGSSLETQILGLRLRPTDQSLWVRPGVCDVACSGVSYSLKLEKFWCREQSCLSHILMGGSRAHLWDRMEEGPRGAHEGDIVWLDTWTLKERDVHEVTAPMAHRHWDPWIPQSQPRWWQSGTFHSHGRPGCWDLLVRREDVSRSFSFQNEGSLISKTSYRYKPRT